MRPGPGGAVAAIEIDLDAVADLIAARVVEAIEQRLPASTTTNGGWLGSEDAARHLGMSKEALRAATRRGLVTAHRNGSDKLAYKVVDLDRFAVANDR